MNSVTTCIEGRQIPETGGTNLGTFSKKTEVQIHYKLEPTSPELSPLNNKKDPFNTLLTEKTLKSN